MVVLVTGAQGQLGLCLQSISSQYPHIDFVFCDASMLDITDKANCKAVFAHYRPQYCINAAAYTAVDKAEEEVEKAFAVNAQGAENIAQACLDTQTVLVHISTDFVFDGRQHSPYKETDQPNPQTVYGRSKRAGEEAVRRLLKAHYILRTSWLFSPYGNNFMKTMIKLSESRTAISVVDDQRGTPTNGLDLAVAILDIIGQDRGEYGTYHFSNAGQASWYEFAVAIFKQNQIDIQVHPIASEAYPTKAIRPKYSVLDKSKIKDKFQVMPREWQASIPKF
ncbi:dTDP-4-dehydrorhamnose reductase [Flavobacterium sp. JP2137]|uniref:dTDP-4-dehydrorhamnose reductase n=1 Tax=Flavobacterium sp. JP2137 TaxID=3414510 RepID=UPI003D2FE335